MTGKILIVEDDVVTRRNLSVLLSDEGYDVDQAGDGVQALEILAGRPFDLVLSDIVMPRMDGLAVLLRIRQDHPAIRVVMITGAAIPEVLNKASELGAHGFVVKPFNARNVLRAIDGALRCEAPSAVAQSC